MEPLDSTEAFKMLLRGPALSADLNQEQRDLLKEAGYVDYGYGFVYLTTKGVEAAIALGFLKRRPGPLNPVMQSVVDGTFRVGSRPWGHAMRDKPEMLKVDDIIDKLDANLGF